MPATPSPETPERRVRVALRVSDLASAAALDLLDGGIDRHEPLPEG